MHKFTAPPLCFLSKPTLNCTLAPWTKLHKISFRLYAQVHLNYTFHSYFTVLVISFWCWAPSLVLEMHQMCCVLSIPKRKRKRKRFPWPFNDTLSRQHFQRTSYLKSLSVIKHVLFVVPLTNLEGETYQIQWPLFQLRPAGQATTRSDVHLCCRPLFLQTIKYQRLLLIWSCIKTAEWIRHVRVIRDLWGDQCINNQSNK